MARARVEAVKVAPEIEIVLVEAAIMALQIGFHQSVITEYSLLCGLARVRVEPVQMVV